MEGDSRTRQFGKFDNLLIGQGAKTFEERKTFEEMFRAKLEDVLGLATSIIHLQTLDGEIQPDDWIIVSAMEIDLLMDITPENIGVVVAMIGALRSECRDEKHGFPAWKRVGRKILSRCRKLGFVMVRPSLHSDIVRNENNDGWAHTRYAFITRKDTVGPWETCYVMRTSAPPDINESILVPAPTCRPPNWTVNSPEVATEVPCAFILVHPDLGLVNEKET